MPSKTVKIFVLRPGQVVPHIPEGSVLYEWQVSRGCVRLKVEGDFPPVPEGGLIPHEWSAPLPEAERGEYPVNFPAGA